jgi:hypothetical protein
LVEYDLGTLYHLHHLHLDKNNLSMPFTSP